MHRKDRGWQCRGTQISTLFTIIAAPVYVDAASVVAGKLGEGETCGVRCGQSYS